jgi:integrase
VAGVESDVRQKFPTLWGRPVTAIRLEELEDAWNAIEGKPAARRAAAVRIRTVLRWGTRKRKLLDPMAGAELPKRSNPRERKLGPKELLAVWTAASKLAPPYGERIKFQMATLVRGAEAMGARWSEFSDDLSEWLIPASRMKGGIREQWVPIPPAIRDMLAGLPRASDLVFSFDGRLPSGTSHHKVSLDRFLPSDMERWRLHDLRRSAAVWLQRARVDPQVIAKLLAHGKTAQLSDSDRVYLTYEYQDERRDALERYVNFLTGGASASITLPAPPKLLPAPLSTSIPAPLNGEGYEALRRELEIADLRTALIARILGHPDMDGPKGFKAMVRQRKRAASKYAHRDVETIILTMAWILTDMMLYGMERICRPEIERLIGLWVTRRDRKRGVADRRHIDAQQARDRGQTDLASSIDGEAREAEAAADLCDGWIEGAKRFLDRLDDETPQHPSDWARTLARLLTNFTSNLFRAQAPELACKMVKMATGRTVLRGQTRRWPKDLMAEPPGDAERDKERERSRKDAARCLQHQQKYDTAFEKFGQRAPQPAADAHPPEYRRKLFALAQSALPAGHPLADFDPQDIGSSAIIPLEAQLLKALAKESEEPLETAD